MNNPLMPDEKQLAKAKILIVDDEEAHIRVLEWALRQANFPNFRSITDSTQAFEELIRFQPDIVLLDLNMPKLDGFAVLQQFRSSLPPDDFVPVLVLTGENTAETRGRALESGAQDFLNKPLDYTDVMLRIRNLLQTRFLYRLTRELKKQLDAAGKRDPKTISPPKASHREARKK